MEKLELIKELIKLAKNELEINSIIEERLGYKDYIQKIDYIKTTFGAEVVASAESSTPDARLHDDYWALLAVLVDYYNR